MTHIKTTGWIALFAGVVMLVATPFLIGSDGGDDAAKPAAPAALARTTVATPPPPVIRPAPARVARDPAPTPAPKAGAEPSKDVVRPTPPKPVETVKAPAPTPVEKIAPGSVYTVRSGDSLPRIAKRAYGDAMRWHDLYLANLEVVSDPNVLRPGWVLRIPK